MCAVMSGDLHHHAVNTVYTDWVNIIVKQQKSVYQRSKIAHVVIVHFGAIDVNFATF